LEKTGFVPEEGRPRRKHREVGTERYNFFGKRGHEQEGPQLQSPDPGL